MTPLKTQAVIETAKAAPAIAGATAASMSINEWVGTLTAIYIIVQLLYLLRKWQLEERERKNP